MAGTPLKHGVMRTDENGCFRVLQITDFHTDAGEDAAERTYADIRAMITHFRPHLLAVTGDIWCGDDKPELGPELMRRDLERLGALGVPWAFTWGNHDFIGDFDATTAQLRATPGAVMPAGDGRGNYRIEIVAARKAPVWDLFFLNSRTWCLLPEDTDWLVAEAARLGKLRGHIVPAIAFFHIPLKEYETARLSGTYRGIAQEEASFWGNDETRFQRIREAGCIRACFVGHSHVNDYYFHQDGIVLAYGRVTGHGGYGGELIQPGGKLITLHGDTERFEFITVFADGTAWQS
ncbi:MAG: metallophosphoesterase [Candidatus Hydrogenedentes bacterium]|nr:metallophosphoesterase [Candidatus Hydrogenedentota bacterium]